MPRAEARSGGARRGIAAASLVVVALAACTGGTDPGSDPDGSDATAAPPVVDADVADPDPEAAPPAASGPAPLPPPSAAARAELVAALEDLVDAALAVAPDVAFGVLVVDEAGREVVAADPDRALLPASTLKQVTAAGVLTTLGRDAQLRTVVDATGGIDPDGRLDGDLVLVGAGDPGLVTEEYARFVYPARPRTPLVALVDQLVAAGLTEVTGSVHGTAPAFDDPSLPTGWRETYLSDLDGRYGAGLTVDGGLVTRITLPPEDDEDDDGEEGDDEDEADDEDAAPVSILDELARRGDDVPPSVRVTLTEDPVRHAATELARLLAERGVVIDGGVEVGPPAAPVLARLAAVDSPALLELLRFTVQRSDNHLADALFQLLGRTRTGQGSWTQGARALTQVLDRFGIDAIDAAFADGSGLSRDDRVTARLLVDLDRAMTDDARFAADWRAIQAATGRDGTLRSRLAGTVGAGRFLGKTGTLRDVTALSGQVLEADADPEGAPRPGERGYHLAVVANEADAAGRAAARTLADELVLYLVADLDGCATGRDGEAGRTPLDRPPLDVRC